MEVLYLLVTLLALTTPTTGALAVVGGVGISGDTNVGGVVTVLDTC